MEAASKHLTPVTLELGGKCPSVVLADANLAVVARRIAFSKWVNAGQTCISTDYVIVMEKVAETFLGHLKSCFMEFAGLDPNADERVFPQAAQESESYGRVVNTMHAQRLANLLSDARERGATVVFGGSAKAEEKFVCPTVLLNVNSEMAIMQEEIFGPLLPIVVVTSVEQAIAYINDRPKPLALYLHTSSSRVCEQVEVSTSSGALVVNDCMMHYANPNLPFGGIGNSGMYV